MQHATPSPDSYRQAPSQNVEVQVETNEAVGHLLSIVTGRCRWLRTPVVRNTAVPVARAAGLQRGMRLTLIGGSLVPNINLTEDWLRQHIARHTNGAMVSIVFAWQEFVCPSWLVCMLLLAGSLTLTVTLLPVSLTVEIGGSMLLSFATYPLMIAAWIFILWRCTWLDLQRKILSTFIMLVCISFVPMLEASFIALGSACSMVAIPCFISFSVSGLGRESSFETHLENQIWKSFFGAIVTHFWLMISTPFILLFIHGGCLVRFPAAWEAVQNETTGETHDTPGVWDLLCGLVFAVLGLVFFSFWCTMLILIKTPFIFAQVFYRYWKLLRIMREECPNHASGLVVTVMWTVGAIMQPMQLMIAAAFAVSFSVVASAVVPAYFAAGWVWFAQRPRMTVNTLAGAIRPLRDGLRGCYLVLWCVQACTNMLMWWSFPAPEQIQGHSLSQILRGIDIRGLTSLPKPQLIAVVFRDGWSPLSSESSRGAIFGHDWVDILQRTWESFFSQCKAVGVEALRGGHLSLDLLEDSDPTVFVGIPGVVVLRAIRQSPLGKPILRLADGFSVTARQIPKLRDAQDIWNRLMMAKEAFETASPSPSELELLEVSVLMGNGDPTSFPSAAQAAESALQSMEPTRLKVLRAAQARVIGIALQLSQLPKFRNTFEATLDELSVKGQDITRRKEAKSD